MDIFTITAAAYVLCTIPYDPLEHSTITSTTVTSMTQSSTSTQAALAVGLILGATGVALLSWLQKQQQKQRFLDISDNSNNDCLESSLWLNTTTSSSTTTSSTSSSNEDDACIYLDYNGTTPIYPQVLQAMMPYLTQNYGNPSSSHVLGREPRRAVDQARKEIIQLLQETTSNNDNNNNIMDPSSIWFTSCGTESDNLAIQLALQSCSEKQAKKKPHIVTCNVEHAAVSAYLNVLVDQGACTVTRVPVDASGCVSSQAMIAAVRTKKTVLVTLMLANNESGALQPCQAVAAYCRRAGILFHTDAAQAVGKTSVALDRLGYPDMVSLVGHKIGAPKGVACLYVRPGSMQEHGRALHKHGVLMIGGAQEFGRRGGTENVPSIVGFGRAAAMAKDGLEKNAVHMHAMRARLLEKLQELLGKDMVRANGPEDPALRLPNTLSVGLKGVHSGDLLGCIGDKVAASAGATCHSTGAISSVLQAMKVPEEFARGTLRLSLGPKTTAKDVDKAAAIIAEAAKKQLGTA